MTAYAKARYLYAAQTMTEALLPRRMRVVSRNEIKILLDSLKVILKKESDREVKQRLARAGIIINDLLVK